MCTTTTQIQITEKFVLAGNATFTVANGKGEHYTFKVKKVVADNKQVFFFVGLLSGPDNDSSYTYLGMLKFGLDHFCPTVKMTKASKMKEDSKPVKVLAWAINKIWAEEELPAGYSINAAGKCGRCGHTLTHPDGVADDGYRLGFGPDCWEILKGGGQ